jgi:hypothetical protein
MNRFFFRRTAVVIAALVAVVGAAPAALAASAEDWGNTYCKSGPKVVEALNDSVDAETALTEALTAAASSPGADLSTEIDDYDAALAKAQKAAKKAAKSLKREGAPDIKNGAKVQSAAVKAYRTGAAEIGKARAALADIDASDPTSAVDPLFALAEALGNASSAINDFTFDVLSPAADKNPDLARAAVSC